MIFVFTVDTEADNQWDHGAPLRTENVRHWEPFQRLCESYDIPPTYLVTSEIAADPEAQRLLKSWAATGRAEVGAHLHPWTSGPFVDRPGLSYNDSAHAFLSQLPEHLVRAKLETLTQEIIENLGIRPTSFRAGRFGFDHRCATVLADLGYLVDTSVTPLTKWTQYSGLPGLPGGPDFTQHRATPFVIEGTGEPGLLEIPVTIVPTYGLLRRRETLLSLYRTKPARALRRALFRRWLSPQPVWLQPVPDFRLSDLEAAYDCQSQEIDVAVMILHSSELMPGGSPTRPTASSVRELLEVLDSFFGYIRSRGAAPSTLTQAAIEIRSSKAVGVRRLQHSDDTARPSGRILDGG